jgi:outer membrane lipoprotein SlyB
MSMRKVMKKIFVGTSKMVRKVFLKRKISGDISVEYLGSISGKNLGGSLGKYLGSISGKNLKGITGEIFVGYYEEDFGKNIDHYILFVDINSQTNILKRNLKFILNLERV